MNKNLLLVKTLLLATLISLSLSSPLGSSSSSCENVNSDEPFTNTPTKASFCSSIIASQDTQFCCNENWNTLLKQTWSELFDGLISKFDQLTNSLKTAVHLIDDLHCPESTVQSPENATSIKNLIKSTEVGLEKLIGINWSGFLSENSSIVSQECKLKIVQAFNCPQKCLPLPTRSEGLKPCRGYCLNLIHGCFGLLSENLLSPWKHAVNSVRTALRLVHAKQGCIGLPNASRELEFVMATMTSWREPLNWIDNAVCDIQSDSDNSGCYDGKIFNATYKKSVTSWTSKSNPEISNYFQQNEVINKAREELINVTKSLEVHWPLATTTNLDPDVSYQQPSSDEAFSSSEESDYLHGDDEDSEFGSGLASGNYPKGYPTDDEDYNHHHGNENDNFEGSGHLPDNHNQALPTEIFEIPPELPPTKVNPTSLGNRLTFTNSLLLIFIYYFI